jgi:hypothetical protein
MGHNCRLYHHYCKSCQRMTPLPRVFCRSASSCCQLDCFPWKIWERACAIGSALGVWSYLFSNPTQKRIEMFYITNQSHHWKFNQSDCKKWTNQKAGYKKKQPITAVVITDFSYISTWLIPFSFLVRRCSCWPLHISSWCQLGWTPCHRYCSCRSAQMPLDLSGGSSYVCFWPIGTFSPEVTSSNITWPRRGSIGRVGCAHTQQEIGDFSLLCDHFRFRSHDFGFRACDFWWRHFR